MNNEMPLSLFASLIWTVASQRPRRIFGNDINAISADKGKENVKTFISD